MDPKYIIAGLSGVSGYFAHELSHDFLGANAITDVTIALIVLSFVGLYIQEVGLSKDKAVGDKALPLIAVGAASFGLLHEISHGGLGGFIQNGLTQSSYWLAAFALVGSLIHEQLMDRL
jgi:hypothetical protein